MSISNVNFLAQHNVTVRGSGEEVVVLGPGFGTDQSVWRHLVPQLEEKYMVVLYDLMGAGDTKPRYFSSSRYSDKELHGYADNLLMILRRMDIQSCVFVWHSVSGMIACVASLRWPTVFKRIILLNSSPRYFTNKAYVGGFSREDLTYLVERMRSNLSDFATWFAQKAVGGNSDSSTAQEFASTLLRMQPEIALTVLKNAFEVDVRSLLPRVTVPCRILQSGRDRGVPQEVAHYLSFYLGGATTVTFLHTEGYLPQLSSPDIVVPTIIQNIES